MTTKLVLSKENSYWAAGPYVVIKGAPDQVVTPTVGAAYPGTPDMEVGYPLQDTRSLSIITDESVEVLLCLPGETEETPGIVGLPVMVATDGIGAASVVLTREVAVYVRQMA